MKAAIVLGLALLAHAQSNATNSSQSVATITSLTTFTTLGPSRQLDTVTSTVVFTSTAAPSQSASSNSTVSGNNTVSGNSTVSGNNTASASPSSTVVLPTAPTAVAAGGGPNGAPLPGASGAQNGPDDKYIAAASTIAKNSILVGVGGLLLSGALMVL